MEFEKKLFEYKGPIVCSGLAIGLLKIFDLLPTTLGPAGDNTKYIYAAAIVLAGYVYWNFHWNRYGPKPVTHQKTVAPRNLNGDKIEVPPSKIFDNFKRD
jgi:hypothetical protein